MACSHPCCRPFLACLPCQHRAPGPRHRALHAWLPIKYGLTKKNKNKNKKPNGSMNQSLGDLALEVSWRETNRTNTLFKAWLSPWPHHRVITEAGDGDTRPPACQWPRRAALVCQVALIRSSSPSSQGFGQSGSRPRDVTQRA